MAHTHLQTSRSAMAVRTRRAGALRPTAAVVLAAATMAALLSTNAPAGALDGYDVLADLADLPFDVFEIATAPDGTAYVVEAGDGVVGGVYRVELDPPASVELVAATGGRIATGPDGSLYVSDDERVRRFSPAGAVTTVAQADLTSPEGSLARWASGAAIAIGPDGTLYFAEFSPGRVLRWVPGAASGTVAAGDDGVPEQPSTIQPTDVVVDGTGTMWLSTLHGIYRWVPGAPSGDLVSGGPSYRLTDIALGDDGTVVTLSGQSRPYEHLTAHVPGSGAITHLFGDQLVDDFEIVDVAPLPGGRWAVLEPDRIISPNGTVTGPGEAAFRLSSPLYFPGDWSNFNLRGRIVDDQLDVARDIFGVVSVQGSVTLDNGWSFTVDLRRFLIFPAYLGTFTTTGSDGSTNETGSALLFLTESGERSIEFTGIAATNVGFFRGGGFSVIQAPPG